MNNGIEIRLLSKETISDQIYFLHSANSGLNVEETVQKWKIKHYENPLGDSIIFGAYIGTRLVGMNAYMPMEYHYLGQNIQLLQSCDSKVLEECRGKGIWKKIVLCAIDYVFNKTNYACVIGFPNYNNSYPGFVKMNWSTILNMNNYVMINNSMAFAKSVAGKNILKRLVCRTAILQRVVVALLCSKVFVVEDCSCDELVWDDDENKMCCIHTQEWLEWKRQCKSIKMVSIKKNGKVLGSCIYSYSIFEGEQICKIEKFVTTNVAKHKEIILFASLLRYLKKKESQAAFIRVWTMDNTSFDSLCKSCLFIKSSHPNPFIVKQPLGNNIATNWNLSFFDLD